MKYRKKPVTIEAYQTDVELDIPTLEGTMHASVGDYIITGVHGEQYPCKPDIFLETYEPSEGDTDATAVDGLGAEIENLQSENTKLRKLGRDFASYRHFDCKHCGYEEQCKMRRTNCYKVFVDLFNRARELGIEVD